MTAADRRRQAKAERDAIAIAGGRAIVELAALREAGHQHGCQCRRCPALRAAVLLAGHCAAVQ